jgi:hypothetical protein
MQVVVHLVTRGRDQMLVNTSRVSTQFVVVMQDSLAADGQSIRVVLDGGGAAMRGQRGFQPVGDGLSGALQQDPVAARRCTSFQRCPTLFGSTFRQGRSKSR